MNTLSISGEDKKSRLKEHREEIMGGGGGFYRDESRLKGISGVCLALMGVREK